MPIFVDIFFLFLNVLRYIEEEDLLRFLKTVEVYTIFPLFEGAVETGKITKSSFRNWVVKNPKPTCFIFCFKGLTLLCLHAVNMKSPPTLKDACFQIRINNLLFS